MVIASLAALAGVAMAQPPAPPPVVLHLYAATATNEPRPAPHFDPEIQAIRPAVADLPFNTYRTLEVEELRVRPGDAQEVPLDKQHTAQVRVHEQLPNGSVRVEVSILRENVRPNNPPIKVISARVVIDPRKMVKFGGVNLAGGGNLVLVLALP